MIELLKQIFEKKKIDKCIKTINHDLIYCFDNVNGVSHFSNSKVDPAFQYSKKNEIEYFIALDKCFIPNIEVYHTRKNGFKCKKRCDCAIFNNEEFYFLEFYHNGLEDTTELTREDKIFQWTKQLIQTFYYFNDIIIDKTANSMYYYFEKIKAIISMNYFPKDLGINLPLTISRQKQIINFSAASGGLELIFTNKI
jgi:hypothetical protein